MALRRAAVEARNGVLARLMASAAPEVKDEYTSILSLSWIHHDCGLEGVVVTIQELKAALEESPVADVSLLPANRDLQAHHHAIQLVRELAGKKRTPVAVDTLKRLYCTLTPEEPDPKIVRYREEMPLHRLYFHEISPFKKIPERMEKLVEWMADPEAKSSLHPIKFAAKAHLKLLQIYPFTKNSGKLARLLLNLILMREGYHPAIIHSTERHGYYEALRGSPVALGNIVTESLSNSIESGIRFFEERQHLRTA
jgi:Fic family protein